jgi:DNA polymerase III delta prime subunit
VCVADANLFLYADLKNTHGYLRYSFNGVFPNTGIYCDNNPDPSRWRQVSNDLNIKIESQKTNGRNILICLQRNGGWSMGNVSVIDWTIDVIRNIRQYSDRPIVVRTHPGDKKAIHSYIPKLQKLFKNNKSIQITAGTRPLEHDLDNTWAVVNHNSSSIVGPIIMGYYSFITDPVQSQCAEVTNTDFSKLENPQMPDRSEWIKKLSQCHWSFDDTRSGRCWSHMRNYVK